MIREYIIFYDKEYCCITCVAVYIVTTGHLKTMYFFFFISRFLFPLSSFLDFFFNYLNQIHFFEVLTALYIKYIFCHINFGILQYSYIFTFKVKINFLSNRLEYKISYKDSHILKVIFKNKYNRKLFFI